MGWTQQTGKSYNVILCVPDLKTSWKLCSLWTHPKHYKFKDRSWKINSKFILVVASGERWRERRTRGHTPGCKKDFNIISNAGFPFVIKKRSEANVKF